MASALAVGVITIPLMKRTGFRPPFAAAVESVHALRPDAVLVTGGLAVFLARWFLLVRALGIPFRLRDALRLGAYQLLRMRVPSHAAVSATVDLARCR